MANRYTVHVPRKYLDSERREKTHFWLVGTAFRLREKDGFSVKLYSRMIATDQLVLFADEEEEQPSAAPPPADDDNLPF